MVGEQGCGDCWDGSTALMLCVRAVLLPAADEGSHWRQRMEAERLIAAQAQLELELSQQALTVSVDLLLLVAVLAAGWRSLRPHLGWVVNGN